jgi:hypothetical protein
MQQAVTGGHAHGDPITAVDRVRGEIDRAARHTGDHRSVAKPAVPEEYPRAVSVRRHCSRGHRVEARRVTG